MGNKKNYAYTQNRELSWLRFNERVLEEAGDGNVPLLERFKFVSIFTSNLDEFYMIRCGSLYDISILEEDYIDSKSGMSAQEQLQAIYRATKKLYLLRDSIYKNLRQELKPFVHRVSMRSLSVKEQQRAKQYFDNDVLPLLSPQVIDIHHPFPHLANKALYVMVRLKTKNRELYGLVPVPQSVDRCYFLSEDQRRLVLLEDLISAHLKELFTGYEIDFHTVIAVTRNADINLNAAEIDDDEDYREQMKNILKKRRRMAPIRLELFRHSDKAFVSYICRQLHLSEEQVFLSKTPLDLSYVFSLARPRGGDLQPFLYPPFHPQPSRDLRLDRPIMDQLLHKDALLFYPYESIDPFLQLLKEASRDKDVVSIKITVYRLAKNSKIIRHLVAAAENGKEVTVLMELRARFDEQNNIAYAELLENSGCTVLYGIENYKVHSKLCLITRKKKNQLQYFTQIGTGNYNEKTSEQYTDYSYLTAREGIGIDAVNFFQNMAIGQLQGTYEHLLVAPHTLKTQVLAMIDTEIEKARNQQPAEILMKLNSLTDRKIIDRLQEASSAGVQVRLIIRGICCLLPGIPGYTEHVEVHSIVGRYLEHARVYCFGSGPYQRIFISSADMMTRNTEKRVEVACPIYEERLKQRILSDLRVMWSDNVKARRLQSDGSYARLPQSGERIDSQDQLMRTAILAAEDASRKHSEEKESLWERVHHRLFSQKK